MRTYLLVAIAVLAMLAALAQGNAATVGQGGFAKGNRLYEAGQFAEAATAYENDVARGDYTANLFYNLGNAYFRLDDRGRAILNYQRALVLEPGHSEAAANLAFVRGRLPTDAKPAPGTMAWLHDALAGPGVDFWCWLAAGAGWLALASFAVAVWRPRARGPGVALAALGAVCCLLCAGAAWWLDGGLKNPQRAVVLADGTSARYAPADNARAIVQLPGGSEVRVLSEQGAWTYIQFGDGARGWLASDKVGLVVPPLPKR